MTRTYWLSFADPDRPAGQQFLGVIVVDVTQEDADAALALHPWMHDRVEGPWIMAALGLAHAHGVNPGGQVASYRIDGHPGQPPYPRLTLLSRDDIDAIDAAMTTTKAN